MIESEAAVVLTKCAAFDNRTIGPQQAIAWAQALPDVKLADALAAVVRHYRSSTEWCKPFHVTALVRVIRDERIAAAGPLPAIPHDWSGGQSAAFWSVWRTEVADGCEPEAARVGALAYIERLAVTA
jgi:hypothetical protein